MKVIVLTLTTLAIGAGWGAWWLIPTHQGVAWILLFVGLSADLFDGFFARRYNVVSTFGAWLDTVADVALYILFPLRFWMIHFHLPAWVAVAVLAAGLFRLARFSTRGFMQTSGRLSYAGLPVYYLQILLAVTLVWSMPAPMLGMILLSMLVLMVSTISVHKTSVRTFVIGLAVYAVVVVRRLYGN